MSQDRKRVFAFDTTEQAWSFINVASTAGYTAYDAVRPAVNESVAGKYLVPVLREYAEYVTDLARICRTVKSATQNTMNEHVFTFDKFMTDAERSAPVIQEAEDEPMRRRAARHQELPQNRIRMVYRD